MTTARWNKLIRTLTCWLQCGTILSCVEEQTSSAAEGGDQPRTYEIIYNLPQAGQYPLRPDDHVLSCRAIYMCYCFATPFKYSYYFPFFSDSGQWRWFQGNHRICTDVESSLLPHVCCCKCVSINCKMRQLARCGVANMLKVLANIEKKQACPGN